ncbi:MAG: ferric iron uptake transcriptional regulator [Pseudomonadota bacterium]
MRSDELRKVGLKATLPRLRVLEILEANSEEHMSAEDVYRTLVNAGDEIGLATVYRVLSQFNDAGLVSKHNFEDGHAVFELDSGEHHDHIVCVKCGRIVEFLDEEIERRQHDIAARNGFEITDHSMVVYGICSPACPNPRQ